MPPFDVPDLPSHFRRLLGECRQLYVSSGRQIVTEHPHLIAEPAEPLIERMDNLHRGLLTKIFVTLCDADRQWSQNEHFLAEVLLFHLQGQWLDGDLLRQTINTMSREAAALSWSEVVQPFDQIAPLRGRIGELETLVVRIANMIARADGPMKPVETAAIHEISRQLQAQLRETPIDQTDQHEEADQLGQKAITELLREADSRPPRVPQQAQPDATGRSKVQAKVQAEAVAEAAAEGADERSPAERLSDAMAELDQLIGLGNIKEEVRTLTNFLKVQQQRQEADLPTTGLSLHMVFDGNPGTGKTTVARIVGKIYGAMGVLEKGHLIETDRSGLVAEYSGQTGPKTNKKIDEALDGVLFIDEAYTLISSEGEDAFGNEAVQTLLKRMEDERDRLVIILAGYPREMQTLLRSNPGLSSRISRKLEFIDYTPEELARIFGLMCDKNRYDLQPHTRAKVMLGFQWLYAHRDRHFGNGRTSRNLFENAIRRMANRVAGIAELTVAQLSLLEADDIDFKKVPADQFESLGDDTLCCRLECPGCGETESVPIDALGQTRNCSKCAHAFPADWGDVIPS
jgi:hypothetical protein